MIDRKKPIMINVKGSIDVKPGGVYLSRVVRSGNGAVVKFFKRFLGQEVLVIVYDKIRPKKGLTREEILDIVDHTEDAYIYREN